MFMLFYARVPTATPVPVDQLISIARTRRCRPTGIRSIIRPHHTLQKVEWFMAKFIDRSTMVGLLLCISVADATAASAGHFCHFGQRCSP